jgi:hypothetical protein
MLKLTLFQNLLVIQHLAYTTSLRIREDIVGGCIIIVENVDTLGLSATGYMDTQTKSLNKTWCRKTMLLRSSGGLKEKVLG